MSQKFDRLQTYLDKANALTTAMTLIEWDNETLAPKEAGAYTARVIGVLSQEYFSCMTNKEVKELIKECQSDSTLTDIEEGIIRELVKELAQLDGIPADEYRAFAELTAESGRIWAKARKEKDFELFAPVLKKIVEYQKKFAGYRAKKGEKLYDIMLDKYEEGFDMQALDRFFAQIKDNLVPFLSEIRDQMNCLDDHFLTGDYDQQKQTEFCHFIAEYVGFDFNKGVMAISAHPFSTNLHNHDVRITTHYDQNIGHSVFSVIHESGHGIYEQGITDEMTQTVLGQGVSMGMHESQSRFFENIIGRNSDFWMPIYHQLQELFPEQLGNTSHQEFMKAINKVTPGVIRIEADELTYCLHIMIRYELEKMLVEEDLAVELLPELWADKYEEYLGVRPKDVSEGVLQDIHWSQGYFGYFPSYALGSAFGAQMYQQMNKEMNVSELLRNGDISTIREYLNIHIHQYGKLKSSRELLKQMTGEEFNTKYYIQYLKDKYSALYSQ